VAMMFVVVSQNQFDHELENLIRINRKISRQLMLPTFFRNKVYKLLEMYG